MARRTSVLMALGCGLMLSLIGIVLIYSASRNEYGPWLATRQGIWLLVGMAAAAAVAQVPRRTLFRWAGPVYAGGLLLLVSTLWIGVTIRGDRSWIDLYFFNVQPSEIMKVFLLVVLAVVSEKITERQWGMTLGQAIIGGLVGLPAGVILLQSDLGTTLVYLLIMVLWFFALGLWREAVAMVGMGGGVTLGVFAAILQPEILARLHLESVSLDQLPHQSTLLFWACLLGVGGLIAVVPYLRGRRISTYGVVGLVLLCVLAGSLAAPALAEYQKKRVLSFVNPYASPRGSGYNLIQVQIAIGSGGWFGQGYLKGSQSQLGFIPELSTDFIFSVAVEELGLVFGLVICALLFFLIYTVFSTAVMTTDWKGFYLCVGVGILWIIHVSFNLGMCVGLLPVVGLPLPFLSYGGSFMVSNWIMLGLLLVASRRPEGLSLLRSGAHQRTIQHNPAREMLREKSL